MTLSGAVRALRFWDGFTSWAHADDLRTAIPATEILGGTFPVHHLGVEYHGATPSYPLAVWFALTGPSTLALDVFSWAIGVGIAVTGYVLARRLLPGWPALLSGLLLAVPPLVFIRWTTTGNLVYPVTLLVGNLILLGTHRIFTGKPAPAALLVTGLLIGLGLWTNPLVIIYCAPPAVLALRTGLVRRARFWLLPFGVGLGGLPAWLYEAANFPSARLAVYGAGGVVPMSVSTRVSMFVKVISLELLGARSTELTTVPFAAPMPVEMIAAGLGLLIVARAVARDRHELRWLGGARAGAGTGLSLLWMVLVANLALTLPTKRTLGITYFLPLYAVLPIWTGEFVAWVWGVRRWLGVTALVGLLGFNVGSTWAVTLGRQSEPGWRWAELRGYTQPLTDWLTARGIHHLYYLYEYEQIRILAFQFTFLSGTRITAAHPWHELEISHGQAVDAQPAPPFVVSVEQADVLRESLAALPQPVRETRIGTVAVFETDALPSRGFTPIPPDHWTVTTSHRPLAAPLLVDRDASTGWSTGQAQKPGQWLAVDLGAEEDVARVDLLALDWQEVPAGFRVEWSKDGDAWHEVMSVPHYWGPLFFSEHHPFLRARRGRVQAVFDPVRARFLRIVQTGESPGHPWSARELFVYRPAPRPAPDVEPSALTPILRREGVRFVYASHWISARVLAEGRGSIGALDSNMNMNSYGRAEPDPASLERFRPEPGRALLLGADADVPTIRRTLELQNALGRETQVGSYRLIQLQRPTMRRSLARDEWHATASVAASDASRAVDGDPSTRWSAGGPVGPTALVTLDLGQARPVGGLRLRPGSRDGGPATFALESSMDGQSWAPIGPMEWIGPLYWTGYELLRNGRREWSVVFPETSLRYLRIHPSVAARTWDIEEIDLFQ